MELIGGTDLSRGRRMERDHDGRRESGLGHAVRAGGAARAGVVWRRAGFVPE